MIDPLAAVDQKRREAEAMRRLAMSSDFILFAELIDQIASRYIASLIQPVPEDWKSHYVRGLIKGLDEAKTLPERVVRLYDQEVEAANAPRPEPGNPGIRSLDPEGEIQ